MPSSNHNPIFRIPWGAEGHVASLSPSPSTDIVDGSGAHGESVFGTKFSDECFAVPHDRRGRLSMVQDERNSNTSQFMVSFGPMTYMQNLCCAFG